MKKKKINRLVIAGTTSSGKTTVSNFLKSRDIPVVPDITRWYVNIMLELGFTVAELRSDRELFFRRVHELRLTIERALDLFKDLIVFDRGIPEFLAYAKVDNFKVEQFEDIYDEQRYGLILMFNPLPFVDDGVRTVNEGRRLKVWQVLKEEYSRLNYNITDVPVLDRPARNELVMGLIDAHCRTHQISVNNQIVKSIGKILADEKQKLVRKLTRNLS